MNPAANQRQPLKETIVVPNMQPEDLHAFGAAYFGQLAGARASGTKSPAAGSQPMTNSQDVGSEEAAS